MKLKYLAAVLILAGAVDAQAAIKSIRDWDGSLPTPRDGKVATTCSRSCEGYDLTILICPEGEKLVDCPKSGCSYYHKCVKEIEHGQ